MLTRSGQSIGPAPDGRSVTVLIQCRNTPDRGVVSGMHAIVIHEDWSVETPHDLAAERIAVALGGHSSCVGLVDRAMPALRSWVALMLRREHVALRGLSRDLWVVANPAPCCDGRTFAGAANAALHGRSIPHGAARFRVDWDILVSLAAACSHAFGSRFELRLDDQAIWDAEAACTEGLFDVAYLWTAGLSPEAVDQIRDPVTGAGDWWGDHVSPSTHSTRVSMRPSGYRCSQR